MSTSSPTRKTSSPALLGLGLALLFPAFPQAQPYTLVLNELLASNARCCLDPAGEADDWVEIHNYGGAAVDLGGCFLTDDLSEPGRWQIPRGQETMLPAGGYLVVWFDRQVGQGALHAELLLDRDGEELGLFAPDHSPIDTLRFGPQQADLSYGRQEGQPERWLYFDPPTPGRANRSEGRPGFAPAPRFSLAPGFYSGAQTLALEAEAPEARIFYTTDGGDPPQADSLRYRAPLALAATTVVRARTQVQGLWPSPIITATYLIDAPYALPVFSLVADPAHLWDWETGIYVLGPGVDLERDEWPYYGANYFKDWEKPAHLEYFPPGRSRGFALDLGLSVFGDNTRGYPKKSFTVRARPRYGQETIEYPLFADKDLGEFEGLVLRVGDDWSRVRNELVYQLNRRAGARVDMQAYQPAVLLLNGQYWGLYNAMERKDADFIAANHGAGEIDLLEREGQVVEGDDRHYRELLRFVNSGGLSAPQGMARLGELMEVDNFIDYWIYEIYTSKGDHTNIRYWRPRTPEGRWRWISFDLDSWRGADENTLGRIKAVRPARGLWLLGALLEDRDFARAFINRFADLLNSALLPGQMQQSLAQISAAVAPEMPGDLEKWGHSYREWYEERFPKQRKTVQSWEEILAWTRNFAAERPAHLRRHLVAEFGLPGQAIIWLHCEPGGSLRINSLEPGAFPWSGVYFQGVPVQLEALPDEGQVFAGWSDSALPDTEIVEVELTGSYKLTARFAPRAETLLPAASRLWQNYPNPFNQATAIPYGLPAEAEIRLEVYDLAGQRVRQLVGGKVPAGRHQAWWDGRDEGGKLVASGVYLCRLRVGQRAEARKMALVR
jgi:hypothetical protein